MSAQGSGSFSTFTRILMELYWSDCSKFLDWIVISVLWRHDLEMEGNAGNSTRGAHEHLRCFDVSNASSWDKTCIETPLFWLTTLGVKVCEVLSLFPAASSSATASETHKSQSHQWDQWHKLPKNPCRAAYPNTATTGKSHKRAMWPVHVVVSCSDCCYVSPEKFFTQCDPAHRWLLESPNLRL